MWTKHGQTNIEQQRSVLVSKDALSVDNVSSVHNTEPHFLSSTADV